MRKRFYLMIAVEVLAYFHPIWPLVTLVALVSVGVAIMTFSKERLVLSFK